MWLVATYLKQCKYRTFPLLQKVLLDSASLDTELLTDKISSSLEFYNITVLVT